MENSSFKGSFKNNKSKIDVKVNLYYWSEDEVYFVFAPELDVVGYGNTPAESKESFKHQLLEFINYTTSKNTLFDELEDLGWTVNRKKKRVRAPLVRDLKNENDLFKGILNNSGLVKKSRTVQLAV